jgi:hypothetical protein
MRVRLYAPGGYWALSPVIKDKLCNGCGAKGFGWAIPDTIYGLRITEACNIHDYMYNIGKTDEDKKIADRTFLNNLLRIIETCSHNWIIRWLRGRRANAYYLAVKTFGGPAFWGDKNLVESFRYVDID